MSGGVTFNSTEIIKLMNHISTELYWLTLKKMDSQDRRSTP